MTSSTRPLAEVRLRAAGLSIPEKLITSSDITNGKPHPDPYLKAASLLGYPAAECVVVEDVAAGIEAGRAAGARVIAFPTTCNVSALKAAGANWILRNCSDIKVAQHESDLALDLRDHS